MKKSVTEKVDLKISTRDLHLDRKKMLNASIANHRRYLDPDTGLFSTQFTESRKCPACTSDDSRGLFYKSGGHYVTCNKCEMLYLNPAFKNEYLEEYYRNNHDFQGEAVANDMDFYSSLYLKGLAQISYQLPNYGSILDVGCSTGIFLDIAKNLGWSTFGLELNKKEAEIAILKGHKITEAMIESANFHEKFNAITLWDVFEHIKDGGKFLNNAKKLLTENGVIFIQSPSRDALAAKILHSACNMFDGLEHVNLYGKKSLNLVSKSAGFEIVSFETVISEIGVINNYLEYYDPYLGISQNRESMLNLITDKAILDNKLGYKFQACLRLKKS
jgi:SAM-dependent methyltransferase